VLISYLNCWGTTITISLRPQRLCSAGRGGDEGAELGAFCPDLWSLEAEASASGLQALRAKASTAGAGVRTRSLSEVEVLGWQEASNFRAILTAPSEPFPRSGTQMKPDSDVQSTSLSMVLKCYVLGSRDPPHPCSWNLGTHIQLFTQLTAFLCLVCCYLLINIFAFFILSLNT
jgi:hypothetical protein